MDINEFKGYDKPDFDHRVRKLMEIENISMLLAKVTGMLVISFFFVFFLGNLAKAQGTDQLFMVPMVNVTPTGAAIYQPQTGAGLEAISGRQNTLNDSLNRFMSPGKSDAYDRGSNYRAPQYDAFVTGSASQPVELPVSPISLVDAVNFKITNNMPGSSDGAVGTVNTTFLFSADIASQGINKMNLEYRWDFDGDSVPDSYFSRIQSISHRYAVAGEYDVKLEVLDRNGKVYEGMRKVTVVNNDAPFATFRADKVNVPVNGVVNFDTSLCSDNQYSRYNLKYRFDWDGDGVYDTNSESKNFWSHQYKQTGNYNVIMEVSDPEGAHSQASISVQIVGDSAPNAVMSIVRKGQFNFLFDASASSDDHTESGVLRYRWDFNYAGTDDIVFDTGWSNSAKYTGNYLIRGSKKIRLQVMDQQGQVSESYAEIEVSWPEQLMNQAVGIVG